MQNHAPDMKHEIFRYFIQHNGQPPNLRDVSIETIQELKQDIEILLAEMIDSYQACEKIYRANLEKKNQEKHQQSTHKNRKPNVSQAEAEFVPPKNTIRHQNNKYSLRPTVNEKSVWFKCEPFFQKLPSDDVLQKIFSPMDEFIKDQQNENNQRNAFAQDEVEPWTKRMSKFVRPKMQPIPTSQSESDKISQVWNDINLPFQIEQDQKKQSSTFHYLLNAFVEVDQPVTNITTQEPTETPITSFSLLPQIDGAQSYLSLSFNQRLDLELQSLGLTAPDESTTPNLLPFQAEIDSYIKENTEEILPKLTELRQMVMSNVSRYREDQQQRFDMYAKSREKLSEIPNESS